MIRSGYREAVLRKKSRKPQEVSLPIVLTLLIFLGFLILAMGHSRAADAPSRWTQFVSATCEDVRSYLSAHSHAEALAEAKKLRIPQWLVNRAKSCLRD